MDITNKDIVLLGIGAIIGIPFGMVASIWASFIYSLLQYRNSAKQVQKVINGTREITQKLNSTETYTGGLRNKYRKSLGVQIDVLAQGFGNTFFREGGAWPLLADGKGDNWHNFNVYVEPVLETLDGYDYLTSWLPGFSHLHSLTKLCKQLGKVFEELDAAFELNLLEVKEVDGNQGIHPTPEKANSLEVQRLKEAYRELYYLWVEWQEICKKTKIPA
jgi:hypothetical protein